MTSDAAKQKNLSGSHVAGIERTQFEDFVRYPGTYDDPFKPVYVWAELRCPVMPAILTVNAIYASGALSAGGWPHDLASDVQQLDFDNTGSWVATFSSHQTTGSVRDLSATEYYLTRADLERAPHTWYFVRLNRGNPQRWASEHIGDFDYRVLKRIVVDGGLVRRRARWPYPLRPEVGGVLLRTDGTFEVLPSTEHLETGS